MNVTTPLADQLGHYLDLATAQVKTSAANMANIDTPGYKTVGMDFEGEFSKALDSTGAPQEAVVGNVEGLISRPDGNNVSIDRESMQMAQTQLQFRTGIELLRHEYTRMMDAIKSDMR